MKAAILHTANQPLQIEEVPRPTLTRNRVLLRVLACGVCRTDLHIFEGDLPLVHQPLILGHQIVGEVICLIPARRAMRMDPAGALRHD